MLEYVKAFGMEDYKWAVMQKILINSMLIRI